MSNPTMQTTWPKLMECLRQAIMLAQDEYPSDDPRHGTSLAWQDVLNEARSVASCKCDLRTRLVGDGCSVCNPELAAELAADPVKDAYYAGHITGYGDGLRRADKLAHSHWGEYQFTK